MRSRRHDQLSSCRLQVRAQKWPDVRRATAALHGSRQRNLCDWRLQLADDPSLLESVFRRARHQRPCAPREYSLYLAVRQRVQVAVAVPARHRAGGAEGIRTPDLRLAKAALSQLSYGPDVATRVGQPGIEPGTSVLSGLRSSRLSYWPATRGSSRRTRCHSRAGRSRAPHAAPEREESGAEPVDAWSRGRV